MSTAIKNNHCKQCECIDKCIFFGLKTPILDQISSKKVLNFYRKGQTIYLQGNPAFGIYCIKSGKIKISKVGNEGKEIIIKIAGAGDVLGHHNLYSNEPFSATATVIEDAKVCFIEKKFIQEKVMTEQTISINLIKRFSEEITAFENRSITMSHKNVRERLAELLVELKNTYGVSEDGRVKLNIKLTREEIASMVGTANETIIRFISEFKDEGILEQQGKVIYIMNFDKLLQTANLN